MENLLFLDYRTKRLNHALFIMISVLGQLYEAGIALYSLDIVIFFPKLYILNAGTYRRRLTAYQMDFLIIYTYYLLGNVAK
jgi:hypothetical protein